MYGENVQFIAAVTTDPPTLGGPFDDGGVVFGPFQCACPPRVIVGTGSVKFMDGGTQLGQTSP